MEKHDISKVLDVPVVQEHQDLQVPHRHHALHPSLGGPLDLDDPCDPVRPSKQSKLWLSHCRCGLKNRGTPHWFSLLNFTASIAAKSLGAFYHSAKIIVSHRQANIIKMIMINRLWDSSHKLLSAFHEDDWWKLKLIVKVHGLNRSGPWHLQKAPKAQQYFYRYFVESRFHGILSCSLTSGDFFPPLLCK